MSANWWEPLPTLDDLEDDPWSASAQSNYGATNLLTSLARGGRAASLRQNNIARMLATINQMNTPRYNRPRYQRQFRGGGPGGGRRRKHRGRMKGIPRGRKLDALAHAIGVQESGGGYGAYNASSGASGKYQILKGNFVGPGGWDREALGHDVSYRRYMNTPRVQERIARYKLRNYLKAYGVRGAAQAWYGGPGAVGNNNISGGAGYPTTGGYADSIVAMVRKYLRRHRR